MPTEMNMIVPCARAVAALLWAALTESWAVFMQPSPRKRNTVERC